MTSMTEINLIKEISLRKELIKNNRVVIIVINIEEEKHNGKIGLFLCSRFFTGMLVNT